MINLMKINKKYFSYCGDYSVDYDIVGTLLTTVKLQNV